MMNRLRLDVRANVSDAQAYLSLVEQRMQPAKLLAGVAGILREDVLRQFRAGGIPPWQPLSPTTVREERRLGYPRVTRKGTPASRLMQQGRFGPENILIRTGALLSSWTDKTDPHHFEEVTGDTVMIGDRADDMRAATDNGCRAVGVLWGYGSKAELTGAGAQVLCRTPIDLANYLLGS